MTGIAYGVGAPTSYVGQTSAHPFGLQSQQYVHPLQQQQLVLQQLLQIVPQQLQQLIHIVPHQLQQLHNVQQQLHQLQHVLQILPQQLHQLQQLVQNLPQQLLQQPVHTAQQPFGTFPSPNVAAFGAGLSQQAAGPWGFSAAGQSLGYPQTAGILPHTVGYGSPNQ